MKIYIEHGRRVIYLDNGTRQYYSRYLMEKSLGRKLLKTEHVHHKDENKLNDEIDNYEVLDVKEHTRLHTKGKVFLNRRKRIQKTCINCSKVFEVRPSESNLINCSLKCRLENGRGLPFSKKKRPCPFCGKLRGARSKTCRKCVNLNKLERK